MNNSNNNDDLNKIIASVLITKLISSSPDLSTSTFSTPIQSRKEMKNEDIKIMEALKNFLDNKEKNYKSKNNSKKVNLNKTIEKTNINKPNNKDSIINKEKSVLTEDKVILEKNEYAYNEEISKEEHIKNNTEIDTNLIPTADNKTNFKERKLTEKIFNNEIFIDKSTLGSKVPILIETKDVKFHINIEAEVDDKIIEVEKVDFKVIKFDTNLFVIKEKEDTNKIMLFYNGVLRALVKYIYFDKKINNYATAKYSIVVLYNDFSGFCDIDLTKIKDLDNINTNDIKVHLKNNTFYTDHLLDNKQEINEIKDDIFYKFIVLGEAVLNLEIFWETYLNITL